MQSVLQASAVLLLVIPLIIITGYLLKRFWLTTPRASGLHIIKQFPLSAKERIVVVEIEGVRLILGVSQQAIHTLHVVKSKAVCD